jgi:hypothetical protein
LVHFGKHFVDDERRLGLVQQLGALTVRVRPAERVRAMEVMQKIGISAVVSVDVGRPG